MSKIKFNKLCSLIFLVCISMNSKIQGQEDSLYFDFGGLITLDSIVVSASRSGFDVADFIEMLEKDQSFYQAFRNLRFADYISECEMKMFDKKQQVKADYYCKIKQDAEDDCRTMEYLEEKVEGNFFKRKKKHRYYTGKMYDVIFHTHGKQCETRAILNNQNSKSGIAKHIAELEKLVFNPGSEANVPFIGKKTAMFSKELSKYYDFKIISKPYKEFEDCYVFTAEVKEEFKQRKVGKTVIKHLETYFAKEDFQIVARNLSLKYAAPVFDFDVNMAIELVKIGDQYFPSVINYDGNWDIPARRPEISQFTIRFYDLKYQ